ncbi:MAG: BMP family ABC transporter substrate-binding protein [Chloroflexota bacterium]|nr:MAG: BMP family ABC transporter substrate-binding protein [Chloroflexota bacterium]
MKILRFCLVLLAASVVVAACASPTPEVERKLKVGVVVDAGSELDKSFNEFTLKGASEAAQAAGFDFIYVSPQSSSDYERSIVDLIATENPNLVITVGFRMGDATARVAQKHPEIHFAIMDNAYYPGAGCAENVTNCYSEEGGLSNVTSLMFAEDEIGYLAGVLAACMSRSGKIASVAGVEIPPVVRFVTGYQNGARSIDPDIVLFNQYVPDFNDPATGHVVAQDFISQGADVIFGAAGNTGNGALLAAHEYGAKAIGVDVDQYYTYPDVRSSLITSASKNVDVAASAAVRDFAAGKLAPGIRVANLSNGGVGLAPYHDWDSRIPQDCKDLVVSAEELLKTNPAITGAK